MTGSVVAGLLATGMFSFSRLTWTWSVTAEVFALNNLLVAVLLVTAVRFSQCGAKDKTKVSQLGALVCGLCLSNQHTTVVYVAILVPWVLHSLYIHKRLSVGLLFKLTLWFVLGLLPYIYLPLSSTSGHARWTWGDQSTISGFLTHLLRREYGTLELLKDHEGQGLIMGLFAYMEHVAKDLTPAMLFFFATTVFSVYNRSRTGRCEMTVVMFAMLSTYTVFFAWRANLDIVKPLYRGVVERFWLQSDLILVAMAAVAFSDVIRIVNRLVPLLKYHADMLIALTLVAMHLMMNITECDQSHNTVVQDFALTSLKAFPEGAVILTKGDLPSNSLRYYHLTEGVRPDLVLFDQEVLTYDWSVPMLGRHTEGLVLPGDQLYLRSGVDDQGKKRFTFEQLLDANFNRKPVFGCIGAQDHEPSWEQTYILRPFGVCMQFLKKGAEFSQLDDWLKASHQFAVNWSHPIPHTTQGGSTWEEVASEEMWRAKTVAGLYILETVDRIQSNEKKTTLLGHAFQIYKDAIETHPHIPGYWHKNFALVCEKLRHLTQDFSEKVKLIRTTIAHFKAYVNSGTSDPEIPAIEKAVKQLQDYADSMTKGGGGRR
ncbi:hypothetical protein V1264_019331 [Littorina saxatilis]